MRRSLFPAVIVCATVALSGCLKSEQEKDSSSKSEPSKALLANSVDFPVGVAVPADPWQNSILKSAERQKITTEYFDSITAENIMKMAYLQPEPGNFVFEHADDLVSFAQQNDMVVHGHALVWHTQAPEWMNEMQGSRDDFVRVMTDHVSTVASHFAGRLISWDVVNEAFDDPNPSEYRETIWYKNIGPEYIEMAFKTAHQAAPDADLYYNDYDISGMIGPHKLDRILQMIADFQERNVPIHGLGFQMHIDTEKPALEDIRASFEKAVQTGLKVRISELDISVNATEQYDTFTDELAQRQKQRYQDVVQIYMETVPKAQRGGITVWGIADQDSWIPGFRKRKDWPLLFDSEFQPKPALEGMLNGLSGDTK